MDRSKKIIKTSVLGIMANVLLSAFKAVIGIITNSIAITLDSVNNLSDALSSGITVVGTKLAGKKPDKKHPYGYGRIEYISATVIAVIILYAGVTSLIESVKKIISPEVPEYNAVPLVIIGVAVLVKVFLGLYFGKVGKSVNSDSLTASGKDALMDAIISGSTLVAAGVYLIWGISLEAWLGAVISLFIIKSGIEMLIHTISEILGERIDKNVAQAVKHTIASFPEVYGAYDLILHSYGPDVYIGSVHIEVNDTMTAEELDVLEHEISEKVYKENKIYITGISIYAHNTKSEKTAKVLDEVRKTVMSHDNIIQMHGFRMNEKEKTIHFDIIIDFASPDRIGEYNEILSEVREQFPDYNVTITLDTDISD